MFPPPNALLWIERAIKRRSPQPPPDFEYEDWPLCDQLLPQWKTLRGVHPRNTPIRDRTGRLISSIRPGRYPARFEPLYGRRSRKTDLLLAVQIAGKNVHGPNRPDDLRLSSMISPCLYRVPRPRRERKRNDCIPA